MRTHVALLRGINVGGHNKVAMAALREVVTSIGHGDVDTYVQSGNVVFTSIDADTHRLADGLERAVESGLGVRCAVVVVARAHLADVLAHNPYPDETDPRRLHVVFRRGALRPEEVADVGAAEQRAGASGSRDEAAVVGGTLYLHTPDGLGRSRLAQELQRGGGVLTPGSAATVRNWATVTALATLLDA